MSSAITFRLNQNSAFTLAEVLITLVIIGIIAAITMPVITANQRKIETATKLKKFASSWRQMTRTIIFENGGDSLYFSNLQPQSPSSAEAFFNDHYAKYLNIAKIEKNNIGITVQFNDGTGIFFYKTFSNGQDSSYCTYIIFCPKYDDCKKINDTTATGCEHKVDARKNFCFYMSGFGPTYGLPSNNKTRTQLLQHCKTASMRGYCTTLIEYDGWEFKDDYPYKI